ncbi:MAG: helix-hairpin-helix domain-containing protein, partial [Bacteroidaceae bacterium]|nr:helix-hairpin-helix domain-containing protein [Bacteroidaceae bacterium]
MLKKLFITLLFIPLNIALLNSQNDWQSLYEAMLEEYDEEVNSNWQESLYEELCDLHEHPLNINIATSEELKQIPFLTDIHIQSILQYIQQNGGMMSMGELLLIESLDYHTRNLLQHFVYAGDIEKRENHDRSWKNILRHSHHEVITRLNIPLYQKAGYRSYSDSILSKYPNRQYLGEPFYHNLRYRMKFSDKLSLGFSIEKDAGEPLFKGG